MQLDGRVHESVAVKQNGVVRQRKLGNMAYAETRIKFVASDVGQVFKTTASMLKDHGGQ